MNVQEEDLDGIKITRVSVMNPQAAAQIGKPPGRYFTLECPALRYRSRDLLKEVAGIVSRELAELAGLPRTNDVLIVGLGNWQATPDALGPRVVSQLMITRHIREHLPQELGGRLNPVAAISPGVLGITGMETIDIVKGIVREVKPDLVITVDALAAGALSRLLTTIQIADTGSSPGPASETAPGSTTNPGHPRNRNGVPTVVSGAAIASDVLESYLQRFNPMVERPLIR